MGRKTSLVLSIVTLLVSASARAQEGASEEVAPEESAPPTPTTEAAPVSAAPAADGGRFRFGINAGAGLESVSANGTSASGAMYGLDLRLGWQFNDLLAVYVQPHLSFGSISANGAGARISGGTGTFIGTIMGEVTFLDRFFAGGGVGYGMFNNPSGLAIDLRAGGYPLMGRSDSHPRRKGLMVGVDFRTVFLDGATGIHFTGCIGYEAF